MGKAITEKTIRELAGRGERRLVLPQRAVVSALARDAAAELGIELVNGHDGPPGDPVAVNSETANMGAGAVGAAGDRAALDSAAVARIVAEVVHERLGTGASDQAVREIVAQVLAELGNDGRRS